MKEIFNNFLNGGKTKEAPKEKEHQKHDTEKEQNESGTKHAKQENGDGHEQKAAGI